jgi:pantoate--beta-alanine ligase
VQTIRDLGAFRNFRSSLNGAIALVPTMGALHAGHMALVEASRSHASACIVSIFVNPLQFGRGEDLSRYPRPEADDLAKLEAAGVLAAWLPAVATMYPDGFATTVHVKGIGDRLEGAQRPGHFDGVATVVAKLFGQVRPDVALFGEKDWQQLAIVRRMVADLDMNIGIVGVPTSRDADGLALSSRNAYLSPDERRRARALPQALLDAAAAIASGTPAVRAIAAARRALEEAGFAVDYVEAWDGRLLAAARIGTTRLIDNIALNMVSAR